MSSLETTEMKLKSTPTGGMEASHSPYYRRLLSAGYKGYLQGTIGGASLYGTLGLVVGALVAFPIAAIYGAGLLAIIPAAGALGIIKGASTFGNIGSVAAINAESADLAEQRRYLLDRYYDLPEGPEGDKEAEVIKKELMRQHEMSSPPHFFHWKTVLICAAVGAALAFGFMMIGPAILPEAGFIGSISEALSHFAVNQGLAETSALALKSAVVLGGGAAIGALSGATVGIDRYYVRKWFDHTEGVVHSSSHAHGALMERTHQVERLKEAAKEGEKTKPSPSGGATNLTSSPMPEASSTKPVAPVTSSLARDAAAPQAADTPRPQVSKATLERRLVDLQQALEVPAL